MIRRLLNWITDGLTLDPPRPRRLPISGEDGEPLTIPSATAPFVPVVRRDPRRLSAQRAFLRRLSTLPNAPDLVLRGSFALLEWLPDDARSPNDLDFVAADDLGAAEEILQAAAAAQGIDQLRFEIESDQELYGYSDAPGVRYEATCWGGQNRFHFGIDVAEGEALVPPPITTTVAGEPGEEAFVLQTSSYEQALAWKLRWLIEDEYFVGADLYDAALIASRLPLDRERVQQSISEVFQQAEMDVGRLTMFGDLQTLHAVNRSDHPVAYETRGEVRVSSNRQSLLRLNCHLPELLRGLVWLPEGEELGFLQQIEQDPDDLETRLIYADWLEEQGDERGEFLRLQLSTDPDDERRARQLESRIDVAWLGRIGSPRV